MKIQLKAPENLAEYLEIVTSMSKAEIDILQAYLWFHKERVIGNHTDTYPGVSIIRKMSKRCKSTVDSFIEKFEGIIFSHKNRRNFETGQQQSNLYFFNQDFMDHVILLEACGWLKKLEKNKKHDLKKVKINIWDCYMKNEFFLHESLYRKGLLIDNGIGRGFLPKLGTMKSYLLSIRSNYKVLQEVPVMNRKKEYGYGIKDPGCTILANLPLSNQEKRRIQETFGPKFIKKAREDYIFANGGSGKVPNAAGFIWGCCRKRISETLRRK